MKKKVPHKFALVVPIYNEEKIFPFEHFLVFAQERQDILFCFVNNASQDQTLQVLKNLEAKSPKNVCVHSLKKNMLQGEAEKKGMEYVYQNFDVQFFY